MSGSEPVVLVASAEFTLKSYPVRRTLEQRLIDDLRVALNRIGLNGFIVEKHAARLVIRGLPESASKSAAICCARVFGVAYAVAAEVLPPSKELAIAETVRVAQASLKPMQSFAIRCRRTISTALPRREIEVKGGLSVLRAMKDVAVRVDLRRPDLTISVDLAGDRVYVYGNRLQGPGGLPISSHWKMLGVLDSGPLSILAAYAMMRRGCLVELLIPLFEAIPSLRKDRQLEFASKLRALVTRSAYKAFAVNLECSVNQHSIDYVDAKSWIRSVALRVAKEGRFRGIVFSDIIGNLGAGRQMIQATEHMRPPIFYPLLGLEIEDLIEMCRAAGLSEADLLLQIGLEKKSHDHEEALVAGKDAEGLVVEEIWL